MVSYYFDGPEKFATAVLQAYMDGLMRYATATAESNLKYWGDLSEHTLEMLHAGAFAPLNAATYLSQPAPVRLTYGGDMAHMVIGGVPFGRRSALLKSGL